MATTTTANNTGVKGRDDLAASSALLQMLCIALTIVNSETARLEMRVLTQTKVELRRRLAITQLDLDLERICLYLEREIEQSTSLGLQKQLVAEFGLLDKQLQVTHAPQPHQPISSYPCLHS